MQRKIDANEIKREAIPGDGLEEFHSGQVRKRSDKRDFTFETRA
jgi:hypothetical protein